MNIFRKKLPDREWIEIVYPLLNHQNELVANFERLARARANSQQRPDSEVFAEAFFQLYSHTKYTSDALRKMRRPTSTSAQQAHKVFQQALKQWKDATEQGRKYASAIAGGLGERASAGGLAGRASMSAVVFHETLFYELMERAKESLERAGQLIESITGDIVSQTAPSSIVAGMRYGKELLNGVEELADLIDSSFPNMELPYAPLNEEPEYDDYERTEIAEATAVRQHQYADQMCNMNPESRNTAHWIWVETTGISDGLLKVASSRCREERDYAAALHTWLKWYTNRSQREGWGINPDAWILLTEIYAGLGEGQKAIQTLFFALTLVATELGGSSSDLVRSHLLQERLLQLRQLATDVKALRGGTPTR